MKRVIVVGSAGVLLGLAVLACVTLLRTRSVLREAQTQVARADEIVFTETRWSRAGQFGFAPVEARVEYAAGAEFAGRLYLAGAGGVAFGRPGGGMTRLEPGRDLPASPIVALAVGQLRGDGGRYLIAATRDQGLLLFSADPAVSVRQVLPESADARHMTALKALASGDVLIGTERLGVLRFDGRTLKPFQPTLRGLAVTALAGDESEVWVGTRTDGVLRWHAGQTDHFDETSGLPDRSVEDTAAGPQGVFVGTPLGVAVFRDGRPAGVMARGLFARHVALSGVALLVGTVDEGIKTLEPLAGARNHLPMRLPSESDSAQDLSALFNNASFFTADGVTLALSDGVLARQGTGSEWTTIADLKPAADELTDRNVSALFAADDGRVWVGYFDRGLDVLDPRLHTVTHVEDDRVFCVNRIVADAGRHTVDVATANGLVLFDPGDARPRIRQVLGKRDGLISDQVTDVAFTRGGMTAATPAGLTFFGASGPRSLYSFQGLANDHVYALAGAAASDHLLAGTLGGLSVLDDEAVRTNLTLSNSGLKRNWITAIVSAPVADGSARWLVGTYGGGVTQLTAAGRVTEMPGAKHDAVINPNAMLVTERHVFAGSLTDGLLVLDRATERWSAVTAGLPSRNVTALAEHDGVLYVGTENGLVRIAEARLP